MSVCRAVILGCSLLVLSLLGIYARADTVAVWGAFDSAHPYAANTDRTWQLDTSARRIRLHFTGFNTEELHDRVVLTDSQGLALGEPISGARGDFWTPWFDAGDVSIRFITDGDGESWGFRVDQIEVERPDTLVNINTATAAELQTLKGVGSATAANILAWRAANGAFVHKRDLLKVSGIGPTTYRGLQANITTRVELNSADRSTLLRLPSMTGALADAILARRALQAFQSVEDLAAVAGVDTTLLDLWRPRAGVILGSARPTQLNVNLANGTELQTLKGIGPTLSSRIVASRLTEGWFRTANELTRVKGITTGVLDGFRAAMYAYAPGIVRIQTDAPAPSPTGAQSLLFGDKALAVAAFNVQVLGVTKLSKPEVLKVVTDTIRRYDLILIQELRDSTGEALRSLHASVNAAGAAQYDVLASDRLGRTVSKEQYVWFWRRDRVSLVDSFHYDDGPEPAGDLFEREPHVALFSARGLNIATIGIHTSPDDAVREIDALTGVVAAARARWGTSIEPLVMGDFNADCSYVRSSDWGAISLRDASRFQWLIDDAADTTASATDCAYDRMVVSPVLAGKVLPGSAKPVRIDQLYRLDGTQMVEVSDHYPIELGITLP